MNSDSEIREILIQIRDLLIPIAEVNRPQYEEMKTRQTQERQQVLASKVLGAKSRKAALLMDGTRSQAVIAKESGVDTGNLSKLVRELTDAGLVETRGKPQLVLTVSEVEKAFADSK